LIAILVFCDFLLLPYDKLALDWDGLEVVILFCNTVSTTNLHYKINTPLISVGTNQLRKIVNFLKI
jgi:hypothetical protein